MNLMTKDEPVLKKKEKQKKKKITEVRKQNSLSKAREECCFFLRKVTHINHQKI